MAKRLINLIKKGHYTVGIALFVVLGFGILGIQKILNFYPDSDWWGVTSASLLAVAILISYITLYRLYYYLDYKFWPARANKFIERFLRKLLATAIITDGLVFAVALIMLFSYFH